MALDDNSAIALIEQLDRADRRGEEPDPSALAALAVLPPDEVRRIRAETMDRRSVRFEGGEILARADTDEGGTPPTSRHSAGDEPSAADVTVLYDDAADAERAQDILGPRQVEHVATSERACGWAKDVVLQSAWDFSGFFAVGGPLLHAHSYDDPSVGRVLSMRKARVNGERVQVSRSEFLPEGINSFADMLWHTVALDFIRGVSVGFRVLESVNPTEEERLALSMGQYSVKVTKADLIELSITAIPADRAAVKLRALDAELTRAAAEGRFDAALVARYAPSTRALLAQRSEREQEAVERAQSLAEELREMREALGASESRILDAVRVLAERFDEAGPPEPAAQPHYTALFDDDRSDASEADFLRSVLDPQDLTAEALGLR